MSTGRWFAASRPDLGAFTFSSSLLPDASAASLDPDPLPPRPLAGFWAAAAAGTPAAAGGAASGSGAGQAALGQAQFAVAHGDKVLLSGGYFDGSLRWVVSDWWRAVYSWRRVPAALASQVQRCLQGEQGRRASGLGLGWAKRLPPQHGVVLRHVGKDVAAPWLLQGARRGRRPSVAGTGVSQRHCYLCGGQQR